jgi:predicted ferric reductase
MTATRPHNRPLKTHLRGFLIGTIFLVVIALILGAVSFAFLYESPSIRYKFGWDKTMLRTGKIVGLTACVLLLLQLPVAGRIKFLDHIFSLPRLYNIHRINGIVIGVLVLLHPILVRLPENRLMVPLEMRYWPEWVGVAMLAALLVQITVGIWRTVLIKRYPRWLFFHRILGWTIIALLLIHLLNVSETFEHDGLPRTVALVTAGLLTILWLAIRTQRLWARKNSYAISAIEPVGGNACVVEMKPITRNHLSYIPGQFAFFSFRSRKLSSEWHPFSFSSSPTRSETLQIIVRGSGDWTNRIHRLELGDRIYIHGPFGRFSHLIESSKRELILIAGGIGITPILSMLRAMRDKGDQRRVTLLWSNKIMQHAFSLDELTRLHHELPHFICKPVFTAEKTCEGAFGRLNLNRLKTMLADCSSDAVIFLCGPPGMIQQVRSHLITIGFPASSIRQELFGL